MGLTDRFRALRLRQEVDNLAAREVDGIGKRPRT